MIKKLLILCICILAIKANATHIVGGEIMYKYKGRSGSDYRYEITLYLYLDCKNGDPNAIASDAVSNINVFNNDNNLIDLNLSTTAHASEPIKVSDVNYKCILNKPNACINKYIFVQEIDFPVNTNGYVITFERCFRNKDIENLLNNNRPDGLSSRYGATYWTEIKNVALGESSPFFKGLPPNFLCTNAPLSFDHSAYDIDGDSLVYELYQPYGSGADNNNPKPESRFATYPNILIPWNSSGGYSTENQLDGKPTLSINRKTGRLYLIPSRTGQFVIGIKVLEYRNGVLIGETKRDFQFNVSNCTFEVISSFFTPVLACNNKEVSFTNISERATSYFWNFGDPNTNADTSSIKTPTYFYTKPGDYTATLIAKTSKCADTFGFDFTVKQSFKVTLPNDTLVCGKFTKTLNSNFPSKSNVWNTGQRTASININKGGTYWVTVTDNPCVSRDTITVINDLFQLDIGPDSVICRDSFVQFTYLTNPTYKKYLWNDTTSLSSVFVSKLGTYWLAAVNQNNCPSADTITFVLYPPPRVNLNDTLFCKNTTVTLDGVNYSIKTKLETRYTWNNGEITPQITTGIPGRYIVTVKNRLCTILDTAHITHIETGLELGNDTFYCGPVHRLLMPKQDYVKYEWHDSTTISSHLATIPGKKKLTITTKEGCIEADSIILTEYPAIDGGLGNDTTICLSSTLQIKAADSFVAYLWNTGATTQAIAVRDSGMYTVIVKNKNGCIISDSVRISEKGDALPIEMYMPNAFTPNNDYINEYYPGNKYNSPGANYNLKLYNRWGEKIFESTSPNFQWDGKIKDKLAQQDIYVFQVLYTGCDGEERWFRGTFNLLR